MSHHAHKLKKQFNLITYAHRLHKAGIPQQAAEIHEEVLENVTTVIQKDLKREISLLHKDMELFRADIHNFRDSIRKEMNEFSTSMRKEMEDFRTSIRKEMDEFRESVKKDMILLKTELMLEISKNSNKTLLWMFSMLSVFAGTMLTVLAKGFHWI